METIKIVSACDNNYAQHLGVMITSLLENTAEKENVEIFLIDGGISIQGKERLRLCVEKYGSKIKFLELKPERYEYFKKQSYFGYATYFRIFIPEILGNSVRKVIYLDCDMVIKGDICKLWENDISEHFLAAVEDVGIDIGGDFATTVKKSIGISRKGKYFNAGVLLINLDKWRADNITEKIRSYLIDNRESIHFADQDGLNAVFKEQWLKLPLEWNQQADILELLQRNRIDRDDMMRAALNPMIIHYTKQVKPWHYKDCHPLKEEYYRYLRLTPWNGAVPKITIIDVLGKFMGRTLLGRGFYLYKKKIRDYFLIDKSYFSDKLAGSKLFKRTYSFLFPFIYAYLRLFSRLTVRSYSAQNKKSAGNMVSALQTLIYTALVPARYLIPHSLKEASRKYALSEKYTCPCCGFKSFTKEAIESHEACRVCCWEYDPEQHINPYFAGGANEVSLVQAQQNFIQFGATERRFTHLIYYYNHAPYLSYKRDKGWHLVSGSVMEKQNQGF
ncbi:MAG TPA: glycosyltransferase [Ruminiclostridium sp.]|nr:glycosyltransferase [Ruminiclostridium sp.]